MVWRQGLVIAPMRLAVLGLFYPQGFRLYKMAFA